jgi:isopentenyl-diphosphate delta-isomerase
MMSKSVDTTWKDSFVLFQFVLNSKMKLCYSSAPSKYHSPLDQYIAVTSVMEKIFKQEVEVYEEMGFNTELKELFHFIYKAL